MTLTRKRYAKLIGCTALALAAGVVLAFFLCSGRFHFFCVFNYLTHLRCPGCGNTRAALSLLRLDFAAAFRFNALFPLEFFYIAWVYSFSAASYIKNGKFRYVSPCGALDIAVLAVILVWFVVRNIIGI